MLDMKERSVLLGMLTTERGQQLLGMLPPEEQQEFFFYQNFNTQQQTNVDSATFVKNFYTNFFERNNQKIPFAKMEDGFVQCILNPHDAKGFITVQLCKPNYQTTNIAVSSRDHEDDVYELETDEQRAAGAEKTVRNNEFRLCQNRFGLLNEEKPNPARNAGTLGIISFWQQSKVYGIHCKHSFYVANPQPFITHSEKDHVSKNVLYVGRNNDVFFFNLKEGLVQRGARVEKQLDLYIQIIKPQVNVGAGELSRETSENCESFLVTKNSQLYDFVM